MYALVTGASSGIGKAYATILARDYQHDLLLVSNQEQELKAVAKELSEQYGVKDCHYIKTLPTKTQPKSCTAGAKKTALKLIFSSTMPVCSSGNRSLTFRHKRF
ncbi:MAG: SDR family NAD(P)-dependent oxidoreductase [Paludibacteraceae bacterium]|nr:SDR family NAD(P)-dependent oxidoreductase [Paludibacteraceae bacterium]